MAASDSTSQDKRKPRPYLGVRFDCCRTYARIYLNKAETAFVGWCPRCARKVEVLVSPDGTDSRFFVAT